MKFEECEHLKGVEKDMCEIEHMTQEVKKLKEVAAEIKLKKADSNLKKAERKTI